MNRYNIFIKGEIYGVFIGNYDYHEIEKPFYQQYPELEGVIVYFSHVDFIISDTMPPPKVNHFEINENGDLVEVIYIPISFRTTKK